MVFSQLLQVLQTIFLWESESQSTAHRGDFLNDEKSSITVQPKNENTRRVYENTKILIKRLVDPHRWAKYNCCLSVHATRFLPYEPHPILRTALQNRASLATTCTPILGHSTNEGATERFSAGARLQKSSNFWSRAYENSQTSPDFEDLLDFPDINFQILQIFRITYFLKIILEY